MGCNRYRGRIGNKSSGITDVVLEGVEASDAKPRRVSHRAVRIDNRVAKGRWRDDGDGSRRNIIVWIGVVS